MAIPYRNSQFVSDWLKPQTDEWQNAPFMYPRRTVRTRRTDQFGINQSSATELDRGFMRNLMTETTSTAGITTKQQRQRFNFQFNPDAIEQAVQMRQEIYLPILQDPSQFAQPMSAVATFNFELLLDRTMEVGSNTVLVDGQRQSVARFDVDLFGESNPATDVYQIGVLSDLQVLYSIIGQGFSNKFIESQLEQLKIQAKQEALSNADLGVTEADINSITASTFDGAANFGNNAFLIPMPVRVVFSELFMVDGFVTSTTVRFTKFNTNMVPIQASVGLSMNALYIGFAKQKTFLTVQLENAKNTQISNVQASVAQQAEIQECAKQAMSKFVFYCDQGDEWVDMFPGDNPANPGEISLYAKYSDETDKTNYNREFKVGFKDAKILGNKDPIETLFENGATATFSYAWRFVIFGAYDSVGSANIDLNKNKTKATPDSVVLSGGKNKVGEYTSSSNPTASDKESWLRIRSDSIRDNDPEAKPISGVELEGSPGDYNSKYFLVYLSGSATAGDTTKTFYTWKVLKGDESFSHEATLTWPSLMGMGGVPSTPSGNTGTGYAAPATPSTGNRRTPSAYDLN